MAHEHSLAQCSEEGACPQRAVVSRFSPYLRVCVHMGVQGCMRGSGHVCALTSRCTCVCMGCTSEGGSVQRLAHSAV